MTHTETAPAKVNLVLHVGGRRSDGLHELCSLFASIDLADTVTVEEAEADEVVCARVPGENLAARAIAAYREEAGPAAPPAVRVTIEKRIPVAAGLGGGSADAAATLRALDALSDKPLGVDRLRRIGARLGADVPSQVEPAHALVTGAGEVLEQLDLPRMSLVLVPEPDGLATADVYAAADRLGATRALLDPGAVRKLALLPLEKLAGRLENDLERAALSLRPSIGETLEELAARGALAARVTGSGPTAFGVFADADAARSAAAGLGGSIVAELRG